MAFSPDGQLLATAGNGGLLELRDVATGEKGDHEKAVADYTEAIRLAPDDPVGYFQRAKAYRAPGDGEKAASDEREAQGLTK